MPSSESRYNRAELRRDFPDDAACLDWLWRHLYSEDGATADCPRCGVVRKFHRVKSRPSYSCDVCGLHIHPTAGTIFHKSSTSLVMWFEAIYLMSSTRCGISAKQLERELGVTYKTAWRMFTQIRKLLAEDVTPLGGNGAPVEIDETYMGGQRKWRTGRPDELEPTKRPVLAMVERQGRLVAVTTKNARKVALYPQIKKYVLPETMIYTDELNTYKGLPKEGYRHRRVSHKEDFYVSGDVHTNTLEGFFSLLKRGISGAYHQVSAKYLQSYLDEFTFRYNHRNDDKPMFRTLLENVRREEVGPSGGDLLASASPS